MLIAPGPGEAHHAAGRWHELAKPGPWSRRCGRDGRAGCVGWYGPAAPHGPRLRGSSQLRERSRRPCGGRVRGAAEFGTRIADADGRCSTGRGVPPSPSTPTPNQTAMQTCSAILREPVVPFLIASCCRLIVTKFLREILALPIVDVLKVHPWDSRRKVDHHPHLRRHREVRRACGRRGHRCEGDRS